MRKIRARCIDAEEEANMGARERDIAPTLIENEESGDHNFPRLRSPAATPVRFGASEENAVSVC
jgi:hypothetical protein